LGTFPFAAGWYAYVGSAFGTGGLRGRLKHHLAQGKRLHWHIDYLAQSASIEEIWYLASETPYEHTWASILAGLPHTTIPVNRFGASDCKCPAHLFYFPARPQFDPFHALTLRHGDVQCWKAVVQSG
jgi:Uri superfamily endonuclease